MSSEPLHVAVIIGSTREGRFGPVVASWFVDLARRHLDVEIDVIDLAEVDLPMHLPARPTPAIEAYRERLHRADAFVVVTPEYNHGYPGALKQAIDVAGEEWRAKPVGFVSYGGLSGGLRAVEQLRVVFAEVHATTIRDTVSFHGAWARFDPETGRPRDPAPCDAAATVLLDALVWWGSALRVARRETVGAPS